VVTLFNEDFDDGNAASRWTTVQKSADAGSNFAFDYTSVNSPIDSNPIGVPRPGQTTHTGLQLWANRTASVANGINAYANSLNLTQSVQLDFDMYARFADTAGSTIYGFGGAYHSTQDGTWNSINPAATSGYWFSTSSDNGTSRVYRAYEAGTEDQTAARYLSSTQGNGGAGYQTLFPDQDAAGANSVAGTILNRWVNVRMTRDMGTGLVTWYMKNPNDANYTQIYSVTDATQTQNSGTVTVGMADPFNTSLSGLNTYFIFDNVSVVDLPEPASLAVFALPAFLALAGRRRSR
jgi:hypothetical protein